MTRRRAGLATIALLAGASCSLDFSWPLDLPTRCEADVHCPQGLVCRFGECARDAWGRDGEPCNLDGRCEAGLLCDEVECRRPRAGEPVPEWNLAFGNGNSAFDMGLASLPGNGALLAGVVADRLLVGGVPVPLTGPSGGPLFLFARVGSSSSDLLAALVPSPSFSLTVSRLRSELLQVSAGTALVATNHNEFVSPSVGLLASVLLRRVTFDGPTEMVVRRFEAEGANVTMGAASIGTADDAWLSIRVGRTEGGGFEDLYSQAVLHLDALGRTTASIEITAPEGLAPPAPFAALALDETSALVAAQSSLFELFDGESATDPATVVLRLEKTAPSRSASS